MDDDDFFEGGEDENDLWADMGGGGRGNQPKAIIGATSNRANPSY